MLIRRSLCCCLAPVDLHAPSTRPLLPTSAMSDSTEQTENVRTMINFLSQQTDIAVKNNLAHATATTNAW